MAPRTQALMCGLEDELVWQLGREGKLKAPTWLCKRFKNKIKITGEKGCEIYKSYFSRHHDSHRREEELGRGPGGVSQVT